MSDKLWSKTEIAYLKRHADERSLAELAERFHTDTTTVRAKLEELGLGSGAAENEDQALEHLAAALELLHDQKWEKAAEKLEAALAESDSKQLSDRVRQYLQICRDRLNPAEDIDDPYLAAVVKKNRGDVAAALETLGEQAKGAEKDERFVYLRASLEALAGQAEDALASLGQAIELEPKNRVHAYHDPDFASLKGTDGWKELIRPPAAG